MKKTYFGLAAAVGVMMFATSALAATNAGVTISNQATAQYTVSSSAYTVSSPITTFKVAQIVNVSVTHMDVTTVAVTAGDSDKATTFRVTNLGNGPDSFALNVDSNINAGAGTFNPVFRSIVIDENGDGIIGAGDSTYVSGTPLSLAAGAAKTVWVLNNIPGTAGDNATGQTQLKAQSANFNSGAPGTVFAGFGPNGVDVVLGVLDGATTAVGTYKASAVTVTLTKSSAISDSWGGSQPVPGATVTYNITAYVYGAGIATGLNVVDAIPANTSYKLGSLKLDGVALSDAVDADAGDATPAQVTFKLGDVAGSTVGLGTTKVVSFQVTIN